MATPHVAGAMALAMSEIDFKSPQDVYDFMTASATPDVLKLVPNDTVNLLLFNSIDKFTTTIDITEEDEEGAEWPYPDPEEPEMEIAKPLVEGEMEIFEDEEFN